MLSSRNARLAAARRLTDRKDRREAGLFLAEGAPAVGAALRAGVVREIFATEAAIERHAELLSGVAVDQISPKDAAGLSETITPQGLIAVCRRVDISLAAAFARRPRLVAVLVEPNDPGNAGAIMRSADAAGSDAVVFAGGADVYNGKTVRASAGSIFHLDVVVDAVVDDVLQAAREAGLASLATTGAGASELDDLADDAGLTGPTMWLFGNEARGLPEGVLAEADMTVRVPIYGGAESWNLAAAAALCLYASARAQRRAR
ncbi:MAG: TrmH family RNA methyltransferase [Jatrophihabitantaceae bacterium]